MVQAHVVVQLERALEAAHPPAVAVSAHDVPAIRGVAPQLAVRREAVGRAARLARGVAVGSHCEVLALRPDVGRVRAHVHGHVANDLDPTGVGVRADLAPLAHELELHGALAAHVRGELLAVGEPTGVLAVALRPLLPALLAHAALDGAERCVWDEPLLVFLQEVAVLARALEVRGEGRAAVLVVAPHERDVAGERGEPRVRGAVVVCGVDGQDLPVALAAGGEVVDEAVRGVSQRARLAGAARVGK